MQKREYYEKEITKLLNNANEDTITILQNKIIELVQICDDEKKLGQVFDFARGVMLAQ